MKRCTWVNPVLVCQIKFTEWTQENYLRNPVFMGLKEDKDPKDVVREP
jgi:bifunctional non-homologous end joining protein LigD